MPHPRLADILRLLLPRRTTPRRAGRDLEEKAALSRLQATPAAGGPLWGLRSQYFGQLNDRCRLKVREWWDFGGAGSRNMQRKNSVCLTSSAILFLDFWMRSIESSALPARQPSPKCSAPETRPSRVSSVIFQGCKKANQEETGMGPHRKTHGSRSEYRRSCDRVCCIQGEATPRRGPTVLSDICLPQTR